MDGEQDVDSFLLGKNDGYLFMDFDIIVSKRAD